MISSAGKIDAAASGWVRLAAPLSMLLSLLVPLQGSAQLPSSAAVIKAQIQSAPSSRVVSLPGAPVAEPKAAQVLQPGQARIKQLPSDVEAASAALIRQRLVKPAVPSRSIDTAGASRIAVFPGAAEMLALNGKNLLTLRAIALADAPLRYDGQRKRFRGSIELGVVEVEPSGSTQSLSAPIDFQVFGVAADPNRVQAKRTAPPFETVVVEVDDPSGKSINVRVRSVLSPGKDETLQVEVDRPGLKVSVSPAVIQGWGLETAALSVQASEPGFGKHALQLSSRLGRFDERKLVLDQDGMGTAVVRSASIGSDKVTVSGAPFEDFTLEITYARPVRFMTAALIGGLVGGALRLGKRIRFDFRTGRDLALSVLTGAVVLGLYVLGVNVIGFRLPAQAGEVLVFVVSALGAFVGTKLLSPSPATRT